MSKPLRHAVIITALPMERAAALAHLRDVRDRLMILAWQGDGFALYVRRLEKESFTFPKADTVEVSITATELAMILGGIELGSAKRHGINPWAYLTRALNTLPARPAGADLADLLPDAWAMTHGGPHHRASC